MRTAGLALLAGLLFATARADIFHLETGREIHGELLKQDDRYYTLRTTIGVVTLPRDAVRDIEPHITPWDEYAERAAKVEQSARAHFELSEWCQMRGLQQEARRHLDDALKLDPDYSPARVALGHLPIGPVWLDLPAILRAGRDAARAPEPSESQDAQLPRVDPAVAAIQSQYTIRLRGILTALLNNSSSDKVALGRQRVLALDDPLAVGPLMRVLARGSIAARDVLIDALAGFPGDEATMNLAVLALTDDDVDIRRKALLQLAGRDDPRIVAHLRRALNSSNDELVRRAATGLAQLKAREAVPDLIDELTVRRRKLVEVPVQRFFGELGGVYCQPSHVHLGGTTVIYTPRPIFADSAGIAQVHNALRPRNVTVMRTEVLEALKELTGVDFGFDVAAWRRWYEEQQT